MFRQKGELTAVAWRDRRVVHVMSSVHDASLGQVERGVRVNSKFARAMYSCPSMVKDYTTFIGGVDRADQYARYYLPDRKGRKWNIKLFFYLLEMSKVNSYLLMRTSPNHQPASRQTLLRFTLNLVEKLVAGYTPNRQRGRPTQQPAEGRLTSRCLPGRFPKRSGCVVCRKHVKNGKLQKISQTQFGCLDCGKHLCLADCFSVYHSAVDY